MTIRVCVIVDGTGDGVIDNTPDTPQNERAFGRPSRGDRGKADDTECCL